MFSILMNEPLINNRPYEPCNETLLTSIHPASYDSVLVPAQTIRQLSEAPLLQ